MHEDARDGSTHQRATTIIQRVEGAVIAGASAAAFLATDHDWWWMFALFLVFDVSAAGYLVNPRFGAYCYNSVHSLAVPVAVAGIALTTGSGWAGFIAPIWLLHIGVDRAVGYGLKEPEGFRRTHLDA